VGSGRWAAAGPWPRPASGSTWTQSKRGWEAERGCQAGHRLLDRRRDPTATDVQNDVMAVDLLAALPERGRRVPAACAVAAGADLTAGS